MTINKFLSSEAPPVVNNGDLSPKDLLRVYWKYRGIKKNFERDQAFWLATNDNLQMAYEKLDEKEAQLSSAYEQIAQYLANIQEGLVLIDRDFIIQNEYSQFMHQLFKTDSIGGENFIEFTYPDMPAQAEAREELRRFLQILFTNTSASMEMIMDVNPLKDHRMYLTSAAGFEERVVSAKFIRIMSPDDSVENLMVIFEDNTERLQMEQQLREQQRKSDSEISTIQSILRFGVPTFAEFLDEITDLVDEYDDNLSHISQKDILENLYSHTHSLKGSARYYEVAFLAEITHDIEERLNALRNRDGETIQTARYELEAKVEELRKAQKGVHDILDQLRDLASSELIQQSEAHAFVASLERMTTKLGDDLGKPVNFSSVVNVKSIPMKRQLKNPIIHLIRNALDHGIEDSFQRISKGKQEIGNIRVSLDDTGTMFRFSIRDDGAGINSEKVLLRARERNIPCDVNGGLQEALRVSFLPEFSTKRDVTEISGRGFGLHIVKEAVTKLRGKIKVRTKIDEGTMITIEFPHGGSHEDRV